MPCLIFRTIYSSIPDGGGVRGTAAGTVHVITTGVGFIITIPRISTRPFLPDGETITVTGTGKDTDGNTGEYRITNFNGTGAAGRKKNAGKNKAGV